MAEADEARGVPDLHTTSPSGPLYRIGRRPDPWTLPDWANVGHSTSLARFRDALASRVLHHGLDDLDAATIRLSAPRRFTQEISRYVYDLSTSQGQRRYAGITYRSRLGDEFRNWAIFETPGRELPWSGEPETESIGAEDPDLVRALQLLGVRLSGG